ncbi:PAS domain-containing sensor histidine kinase [Cesiribacter sp. SM1]|uniref:hybrid sensor histidine kinase/response regulator n=1 Tax=Cesiribacter sp. SM1 TaxID=2861196 RepID=UPI001CD30E07|nr:PAS domain-containing sensor histidine kinase [Cesiribacter sp. SM1]
MTEKAIRVFFVEDKQQHYSTVLAELGKAGLTIDLLPLQDRNGFMKEVQTLLPDVVLICYQEEGFAGADCLNLHKKLAPQVPAIIIAPAMGEEWVIDMMRGGACDIVLQHKLYKLPEAVSRALADASFKYQQQQREQSLQLSQLHLQDILRMTPVGVFRCDSQKNCFYVNERFCELTGLKPEEAFGTGWTSALHPEDKDFVLRQWYDKKEVVEETKAVYRYQKPGTGETIWVLGQSKSELDSQGRVIGYLGSVTNITRLKLVEDTLKEKNEYLTKVNKELDNFVYSASHNIRAPLTSLMGLINLLKLESGRPHELYKICGMMENSLHRLDGFIRDILDHSRNARLFLQFVEVDIYALIYGVLEEFSLLEDFKQIDVNVNVHQESPLYTDPARLRIVFRNLLSNAIRYQNKVLPPQIVITGRITVQEAVFQVCDNGIGIRQEHHARVFDMFYRADEHRSGSGLGLYITREVVDKMGGKIELSSQPAKGTVVKIVLPNEQAHKATDYYHAETKTTAGWLPD